MIKILWYLLFLLGYGIFGVLSIPIIKPDATKTKLSSLPYLESLFLLSSVMMYVLVLLLTRSSILVIAIFYFLSAQVGILLGLMLGIVTLRQSPRRHTAEIFWASVCFLVRNIWLASVTGIIQGVVLGMGYPVVAGIIYFSGAASSTAATLAIIRITLLFLFVGGLFVVLPVQVGVALSENLSNATRWRFFAYSATSILPNGILLTTLLWTFSTSVSATAHSTESFHLAYSPIELSILASYFVLIILLPYMIGVARSAQKRNLLLSIKKDLLFKAIDILRIPKSDSYAQPLSDLLSGLEVQFISFVSSDKSTLFGLSFDKAPSEVPRLNKAVVNHLSSTGQIEAGRRHNLALSPSVTVLATNKEIELDGDVDAIRNSPIYAPVYKSFDPRNYRLARSNDLRFQYLEWLHFLQGRLTATVNDLRTKRAGIVRVTAARAWADSYELNRTELAQLPTGTKTNALAALVISTIATSLLSVIVTGLGNWLWTQAAHTLLK